jgi:hypothetical protein
MMAVKKGAKESVIQSSILSFLNVRRILNNRINNGQFQIKNTSVDKYGRNRSNNRAVRCNSLNGIPDIEVFGFVSKENKAVIPVTVYLEVKTATGRQSKYQKLFQKRVEEANGFYYVVRSVQDVENAFKETDSRIKSAFGEEFKLDFLKSFSLAELN